jgi:hypothetical protein
MLVALPPRPRSALERKREGSRRSRARCPRRRTAPLVDWVVGRPDTSGAEMPPPAPGSRAPRCSATVRPPPPRPPAPNSQHPLGVPCHHWFVSRKEIVIVVVYLCVFLVSIVTRTFRFRKKERERENIRMVSGRVQGKIFFGFIRNRWEKKYRRSGDLYDWASHGTRRVVRA